jgi:ATP-dependent helicase/nuclease subunit B
MQIVLGPFHPDLERALADEILRHKQPNPLAPLLILVPSDSLRRHLKILLARERALSLLNLPILTFHQLSLELYEEGYGTPAQGLFKDLYLEEVLRQMALTRRPEMSPFAGLEAKIGGCAALWQTLRDLKDGMVNPSQALEAAREGYFGAEDGKRVSELCEVYRSFLSACEERGIGDYSDLDVRAAQQVSSSNFLAGFERIFYYGFYDLTQVQLEVFQAVARRCPTTLFFPLVPDHPGWEFAQRFYERHLQGLAEGNAPLSHAPGGHGEKNGPGDAPLPLFYEAAEKRSRPAAKKIDARFLSCSGPRDEIVVAAKEILRLVARAGVQFSEIGVVARSLEPYQSSIREIFSEHCIPIRTSATEPLTQFPLVKAVLLLVHLAARDYSRSRLIDLVASPFFNVADFSPQGVAPRPDLWDVLTRRLGITRGFEEWRRLERYLERDLQVPQDSETDELTRSVTVPAEQLGILWNIFRALHRDLSALPAEASWSEYASAWKTLLRKYLAIEAPAALSNREDRVRAEAIDTLDRLGALDLVTPGVSLRYFSETFERWLDSASIPLADPNVAGVSVLDAMAARGIPFRILFLIGLNEGLFPRTIREDAFLRDRSRRVFGQVLGYKVSEKLGAFDEEKLLFDLLAESARERLYCLYQRSDESGRVLSPSWYLDELRQALAQTPSKIVEAAIPRGIEEKNTVDPFRQSELLLPDELAIRLNLHGADPLPVVRECLPAASLYSAGHAVTATLENSGGELGAFDGIVHHLPDFWRQLDARGISPTALETYARCPFQFFALHILKLDRIEDPEALSAPQASEAGRIAHLILKTFYEELSDRNYFSGKQPAVDIDLVLKPIAARVFREHEMENPVGYAVAWEIFQEDLLELLRQAVRQDLGELLQSRSRPIAFEKAIGARLGPGWEPPLRNLSIQGTLDRIDRLEPDRYRVIDYKVKTGNRASSSDKNLLLAALRGQRLQPPFYTLLARSHLASAAKPAPEIDAVFYFLAPGWRDGPLVTASFPADAWEGEVGRQLKDTFSILVEGVREGRFFIQPGDYCRYCVVSEICRRSHVPSRWRAHGDPRTAPHRDLRRKKLIRGPADSEDNPPEQP